VNDEYRVRIDGKALHTHPMMEGRLGVDSDHVIIDRDVFDALIAALNKEPK
jgi:hypothetical protein